MSRAWIAVAFALAFSAGFVVGRGVPAEKPTPRAAGTDPADWEPTTIEIGRPAGGYWTEIGETLKPLNVLSEVRPDRPVWTVRVATPGRVLLFRCQSVSGDGKFDVKR